MFLLWVCFSLSFMGVYFLFKKKLLTLLMLELSFVSLLTLLFFYSYHSLGESSYFLVMLLLGFMVLDSVLGLCCLVVSSRNSSALLDVFFN